MARVAEAPPVVSRRAVLAFRLGRHQLLGTDPAQRTVDDLALADYGVQDTGPDGAAWALAIRGVARPEERTTALAWTLRDIVTAPMAKGELSSRLTEVMPKPFLRTCRPCHATPLSEQPFRLAALQAGLVLEPGTSPPVLGRAPGLKPALYSRLGGEADARFDVVRRPPPLLRPGHRVRHRPVRRRASP